MVLSLADYRPRPRYDGKPWMSARMEGSVTNTDDWTEIETYNFTDPDEDPSDPKTRNFTAEDVTSDTQWLRMVFVDADGDEDVTDPIPVAPPYTLATVRNVRLRVGRELTDDEIGQVEFLGRSATITIFASLAKPSTWQPGSDAADFLSAVAVEMVTRTFHNPMDLQSQSENIGQYSYTNRYNRNAPGMVLTTDEELAIRRSVYGSNVASAQVTSQADVYAELTWPWTLWYGYLPEDEPMLIWK